ncbi:MAG TPA: zinc-binding dehydrogenase [Acidimicrobiales bacterium]|jgi:threonine dehydrogenase-like Zn-dependent dehydrogenase|nr:zinc-binding dehydrogenase [Acidimicrobiales bacterium]
MKTLLLERLPHRFAAARIATMATGSGSGIGLGPLRFTESEPPRLPDRDWIRIRPRLSGICGSDLATLDATSSRYFEPLVSFPFVPGHEIVADAIDGVLEGQRVVVEPVLGCLARAISPPCGACAVGNKGRCERLTFGHLKPGLQTGYCASTGGGWSEELVAHASQLHVVPEELSDDQAVLVEPLACAIHAALRGGVEIGNDVVVVGAGTVGLLVTAALRTFTTPSSLTTVARHAGQRRLASELGADVVTGERGVARSVRRLTGSLAVRDRSGDIERLTGGADIVFDCVGTASSISRSLAVVRPGGRIVLVGMPGTVRVDLAPLWQREIEIVGAYAYGSETLSGTVRPTFDLAIEMSAATDLSRIISARYPLERYEEAVRHAAEAGRRGAVKVVFDLRRSTPSWQRNPDAKVRP